MLIHLRSSTRINRTVCKRDVSKHSGHLESVIAVDDYGFEEAEYTMKGRCCKRCLKRYYGRHDAEVAN